jgi:hypothetical protein
MAVSVAAQPYEQFAAVFREEHRVVRDLLLDLVDAFEARDPARSAAVLHEVAAVAGPHFRYEEESLYPALVPVFGPEYIEKLLGDHDLAISSARRLAEVAGRENLTAAEADEAVRLTRGILPHVSDCEGLTIMAELFTDAQLEAVLDSRASARDAGIDLLTWAEEVRGRPA